MSKKIQILIVDDHPLYRVGLKMTLRYSGINCEVIAETENVLQTTEYLKEHGQEPDLMMLDYFLSDGTAKDVVTVAEACCPKLKILLLSGEVMHPTVMQLAEKHIDGFISKTVKPDELKLRI
ncbi:MAG: response regulator, partial [Bacteroidales bacterium]|nr:response regulator [Bacteroidales bacterium]